MTDEKFEGEAGEVSNGGQVRGRADGETLEREQARSRDLLAELMEKKRRYSAKVADAEDGAAKARKEAEKARERADELRRENDELKAFGDSLEAENSRLTGALGGYLDTLKARVPEGKHSLIPGGDVVERTEWLSKAIEAGLFSTATAAVEGPAPTSPGTGEAYLAQLERARETGDVLKVMEIKERINYAKRSL